ncbi:MAG TPA: AAA family ATPase [Thermoleophilaceae bacterium]|nr:AAA family ATPase [Thermoleophilaceae bacterium]
MTAPVASAFDEALEAHPHARLVLGAALADKPSHAYLFHGPAGTGKARAAKAFAAELLAAGEDDPDAARIRVMHGSHPDLTWVAPSGVHVMRVEDIEQPVVAAATHTPFESSRRVFVLERVDTMNDEVANRLLKTLEEPAHFVHLILMTDQLGQVMDTVVSRCQLVRFDPLPRERIVERLESQGIDPQQADAASRLALGDGRRAEFLASDAGRALRADVEAMVRAALAHADGAAEPWRGLLGRAEEAREEAEQEIAQRKAERLELEPKDRERRTLEKEFDETAKRAGRRARTHLLELGLELATLTFRDLVCVAEGAPEAVLATDRIDTLAGAAQARDARRLRQAAELCEDTRQSLQLNVQEDLALTSLSLRLRRLVGSPG